MWCLARLLPLIIGDQIPEGDDHWDNFLLLLKISEYVFSPVSSKEIAAFLTTLIDDYLQTFTQLYPGCSIIPKQHYMVHMPQWIVRWVFVAYIIMCTHTNAHTPHTHTPRCGPLTRYWCMRFEAKNSHFKDIAHRIKNFKNIAKSLSTRHQAWACYVNAGSGGRLEKDLISGPGIITKYTYVSQLSSKASVYKATSVC